MRVTTTFGKGQLLGISSEKGMPMFKVLMDNHHETEPNADTSTYIHELPSVIEERFYSVEILEICDEMGKVFELNVNNVKHKIK